MIFQNNSSILLVNERDQVIGKGEKQDIHRRGLLHRAFSIFVFNNDGHLLIHRRADNKYHSPDTWTNTCCSHQTTETNEMEYIHSRLMFEMGFDTQLHFLFKHCYKAEFPNGLIEHEMDHIFYGIYDENPYPEKTEVSEWMWSNCSFLINDMKINPAHYSYWFRELLPLVIKIDVIASLIS